MSADAKLRQLAAALLCAGLAACSGTQPVVYSGLASASSLQPNVGEDSGRIPFRYVNGVERRNDRRVIVDPVVIYRGQDQQFGDISEADKAELAAYMFKEFSKQLGDRLAPASDPGSNALRVRLTLTGAETNTPVLATFTRFDLSGGLYNAVQTVRGGKGVFSGSVSYAAEIYDAATNHLLAAEVVKQYPTPFNITATVGSLAAAKTGIDKGAEALAQQLSNPQHI